MAIKIAIMAVFVLVFVYGLLLKVLESRSARNSIPENVRELYDAETYAKWKGYHAANSRFGIASSTVGFLVDFLLLMCNAYAWVSGFAADRPYIALVMVALLSTATGLVMVPFDYYDTFRLEERYGFNRSDKKTFAADEIKQFALSFVISAGVSALLCALHRALGDAVAIVFAVVLTVLILAISFLFPYLSKLFNKFTPLEDGELKQKLTALLQKNGFQVRAINVMDASRRTTKSNAYFAGFGKTKTIVLYDTMVAAMTPDEICAVFAHEMGHGLHHDTLKNQVFSFAQMAIIALLAWLTVRTDALFTAFGFTGVNYGFALVLILSVEFALVSPLFGLFVNGFSRKAEFRADRQAVREGYGGALMSALRILSKENLSDLSPSPLLVKLTYSHPPLSERLKALEEEMKK